MGLRRRNGELWLDFELRTIRLARLIVWCHKIPRGDIALDLHWSYSGHRARQEQGVSVTSSFTWCRTLPWWLGEQARMKGPVARDTIER